MTYEGGLMVEALGGRLVGRRRLGPRLQFAGREDAVDGDAHEVHRRAHDEHLAPLRYSLVLVVLGCKDRFKIHIFQSKQVFY